MRRMLILAGLVALVLAFAMPSTSQAYPLTNCVNFCPAWGAGSCWNECTGTITTCSDWWQYCYWGGVSFSASKAGASDQCAQGLFLQTNAVSEPETPRPTN